MVPQPNVPWWVGVIVVGIQALNVFLLTNSDPAVTFLTANVKFLIGAESVVVTAVATLLNLKGGKA